MVDSWLGGPLYPCQPANSYEHVVYKIHWDNVCNTFGVHTHHSEHASASLREKGRRGEHGGARGRREEEWKRGEHGGVRGRREEERRRGEHGGAWGRREEERRRGAKERKGAVLSNDCQHMLPLYVRLLTAFINPVGPCRQSIQP